MKFGKLPKILRLSIYLKGSYLFIFVSYFVIDFPCIHTDLSKKRYNFLRSKSL